MEILDEKLDEEQPAEKPYRPIVRIVHYGSTGAHADVVKKYYAEDKS